MPLGFLNVNNPGSQGFIPSDRTRRFEGEGRPVLPVPGLKSLEAVRLGNRGLPLEERRRFPKDHQLTGHVDVSWPVVILDHLEDGTPVLLRNYTSGDGVWQSREPIYVTGDWDEAIPAPVIAPEVVELPKKGLR